MGDMIVKDNFNGFADSCTDMGNSFGLFNKQSEMQDEEESVAQSSLTLYEHFDSNQHDCEKLMNIEVNNVCLVKHPPSIAVKCDNDLANNYKSDECKENMERLEEMQASWVELHKCIRLIYKNAISSVPCIVVNEEIPKQISDSIKLLIKKLCEEDCQQLFIKLEVVVRDFVLEAKDRLKEFQNNVDDIPALYLRGLLASYGAFCVAADNLTPFIPQLDALLMKRFSVNFQLLNKYLFQACLYADTFVQNNVPLYISQLRTSNSGSHFTNQELVHSYLAFDDEMTDIASKWLDVKKMLLKLSKKRIISNCKEPLLLEDWKLYRAQRELAVNKSWQCRPTLKRDLSDFDVQLLSLLDDITNHMYELEINSNLKQTLNSCRSWNSDASCSCEDCTWKYTLSCIETPPNSPEHKSSDKIHSFNSAALLEHFKPISKVNKIQMPKNFIKLITDKVLTKSLTQNYERDNKIKENKFETVATEKTLITTPVSIPTTTASTVVNAMTTATTNSNSTSKVILSTNVAQSNNQLTQIQITQSNKVTPTSNKSNRILKEVSKSTQNKIQCTHTHQITNKKTNETQLCKDGCTDYGPAKNQKESKRCDCPHCEVFENSNTQASSKNNKTRDRLRNRLNEKRNKAMKEKSTKNVENKTVQQDIQIKAKGSEIQPCAIHNSTEAEDTRDIKELIDFIEGTDRNAKLLNAQKRLAKKARRRERKLEEERLKEQERQRIETERLLEEQRKLEKLRLQEEAKFREQQAAKNKKKNKNKNKENNNNKTTNRNNNSNNNGKNKTQPMSHYLPLPVNEPQKSPTTYGGPMVTIKRVMEHSGSEPTVTITLKGSTPDKDKLLYTLVNGQTNLGETFDEKVEPPTKTQKKKLKKEQQLLLRQQKLQQKPAEINKPLSKKERKKLKNEMNKVLNQKNTENITNSVIGNTDDVIRKNLNNLTQQKNHLKVENTLNLQMLRLPPGITITKVEGPAVNRKLRLNTKNASPLTQVTPPIQSNTNRSGVIVVDTVKLKEELPTIEQPVAQTANKKKKKKNKNKAENINSNANNQQNQQYAYTISSNESSTNKNGGNTIVTIKNPMFYQLQESLNGKLNKQKLIERNTKDTRSQQAAIIKGANGMVTIRSPRLNGGIPNGHRENVPIHSVGISDLKPVLASNTSVYKEIKTNETNKPFNAQEILSGLPGIEITKINKNTSTRKNECKVFQPADVSIIPTNVGNGNGDVYKLFSDSSDWSLESVFAPKDIKEDEELDADELELEAFKRFCQQSVPPERKEKVAHLNVKDIVLKKKTSNSVF